MLKIVFSDKCYLWSMQIKREVKRHIHRAPAEWESSCFLSPATCILTLKLLISCGWVAVCGLDYSSIKC